MLSTPPQKYLDARKSLLNLYNCNPDNCNPGCRVSRNEIFWVAVNLLPGKGAPSSMGVEAVQEPEALRTVKCQTAPQGEPLFSTAKSE